MACVLHCYVTLADRSLYVHNVTAACNGKSTCDSTSHKIVMRVSLCICWLSGFGVNRCNDFLNKLFIWKSLWTHHKCMHSATVNHNSIVCITLSLFLLKTYYTSSLSFQFTGLNCQINYTYRTTCKQSRLSIRSALSSSTEGVPCRGTDCTRRIYVPAQYPLAFDGANSG